MPTRGTMPRHVRGIPDEVWAEYEQACREVNGSADRSDDLRRHVFATVEAWRARGGRPDGE